MSTRMSDNVSYYNAKGKAHGRRLGRQGLIRAITIQRSERLSRQGGLKGRAKVSNKPSLAGKEAQGG